MAYVMAYVIPLMEDVVVEMAEAWEKTSNARVRMNWEQQKLPQIQFAVC